MGFASADEVWVNPMARDWQVFLPMVCFWFAVQFVAQRVVLPRVPGWKRFSRVDQEDLVIRAVSIVNGFVMMMSAALFLTNLYYFYDMKLPADLYSEVYMPGFPFFRVAITSYFAWDLITCFWYKWAWAWKIHAIASLLGCYTLMFPFSDVYAGFYTGCFELSNAFLHFSTIYRMVAGYNADDKALSISLIRRATLCEYTFAALFTLIRVVAGTYVTYTWVGSAVGNLVHDMTHRSDANFKPKCHDEVAYVIAITAISTIQLLQYVWFLEIVKRAVGMLSGGGDVPAPAAAAGEETKTKAAAPRQSSQKRRARKED